MRAISRTKKIKTIEKIISPKLNSGMIQVKSDNINYLFLFIFIGLTINIIMSMTLPIRLDEPYTMITTAHSPSYAVERALSFEEQPPIYFFFSQHMESCKQVTYMGQTLLSCILSIYCYFFILFSPILCPKKQHNYI